MYIYFTLSEEKLPALQKSQQMNSTQDREDRRLRLTLTDGSPTCSARIRHQPWRHHLARHKPTV